MDSEVALLRMEGICKAFPGVLALDAVDFVVRPGEVHALMGENGAGKSTLIKVLTGVYPPDAGTIWWAGRDIRPKSPLEAQRLGISTVYQEVNLIPTMSVAENIMLGRMPVRHGIIDRAAMERGAFEALALLDLEIDPGIRLGACSIAVQQLVAIARALLPNPLPDFPRRSAGVLARHPRITPESDHWDRNTSPPNPLSNFPRSEREPTPIPTPRGNWRGGVLVLDEPTSSLDRSEVERLFRVIRRLKTDGYGIIFVTHFLDQVYEIADRITVLRNGKLVGEHLTAQLPRLQLVEAMLGRSATAIEASEGPERRSGDRLVISAQAIEGDGVGPVDLQAQEREVVGLAGLLGSGRTEVARMLFGLARIERGVLAVDGEPVRWSGPRAALRRRFGFVPEDRKVEGIMPNLSVRENIVLALQVRAGWMRPISRRRQREMAERYIKALHIVTPSPETPVARLSGGNQQKVVLARWLAAQPRVLILDEPTRGVDVGAKVEIEHLMSDLCGEGLAIILIGTDLEEIERVSSRVVVMRDRRKVGEVVGEEIGIPAIMRLIAGEAIA